MNFIYFLFYYIENDTWTGLDCHDAQCQTSFYGSMQDWPGGQRLCGATGRVTPGVVIVSRHVRGILDDGGSDAGLVREKSRVRREVFVVLVLARVAGSTVARSPGVLAWQRVMYPVVLYTRDTHLYLAPLTLLMPLISRVDVLLNGYYALPT